MPSIIVWAAVAVAAVQGSPGTDHEKSGIVETAGEYLGQKWRIDRRGVTYWDGKPYIRLTFTFAWEEKQVRLLASHGIKQFGLPVPEDLFQRDRQGVEKAVEHAERVATVIEKLEGTYFAGLSNFLAPLVPDASDELRYVERSVVDVAPAAQKREALRVYALRYRAQGRRLPGPWVLNVPDKMRLLRYTGKSQAYLFDMDRDGLQRVPAGRLSVRLLSAARTPKELLAEAGRAEREAALRELRRELEGEGASKAEKAETLRELTENLEREAEERPDRRQRGLSPCFEIELKGVTVPAGRRLRLVVLHEMVAPRAVSDELGTLPAVWRPGVRTKFLKLVRAYRRVFRRPGLRAMDFGEEQHLLDIPFVNPFNLYPDFRRDEIATKAFRKWLRRRFRQIGRLNQHLGTRYDSFDAVAWQVPLAPVTLPDWAYQRVWRGELETIYDSGRVRRTFGVHPGVEQMARLDALQWEFRDWLYAHHLASLAREAQKVIGHVPTFVASSDFDDHPLRRFRLHRMLMEEGMEGMIRNWYTIPARTPEGLAELPPGRHQDELPLLLAQAMRASGKTKTLLANEIGWPQEREGWPVFRSKQDLRSVLAVMGTCGFRGFHLFSDPTSPEAAENVRWVGELQKEIAELMLTAKPPPKRGSKMTAVRAIAAACGDRRVRELLNGLRELRAEAGLAPQWRCWVVNFFVGERRVVLATVSEEAEILEVSRGEESETDEEPAGDRRRRIERLHRQLKQAKETGNQAEAREIRALIKRLEAESPSDARDDRSKATEGGADRQKRKVPLTSGNYLGHTWHIDGDHLMWWDGKPYVPFGGFGIKPGNKLDLDTYNLWIDFDPFIEKPKYTRAQHKRDIARRLADIAAAGGTCIIQFSMALPHLPDGPRPGMRWKEPKDGINASRLAEARVKQAIFKVWADYAPAVRSPCVRAIVLWNEINVWRWPRRRSVEEYAKMLREYAVEAKRLVGDLPVCFKAAGTWNAEAVVAGAAAVDGLGFDVWFGSAADSHARREIVKALRMLESRQKKTTWFFIAEGGRTVSEDRPIAKYWDRWPSFRSKIEALGILRAYAQAGAKGFIYNGPDAGPDSPYRNSYRWLGQIKPQIVRFMVSGKRPAPR